MTSQDGTGSARRAARRRAIPRQPAPELARLNANRPPPEGSDFSRGSAAWDVGVSVDLPPGPRDIGYWRLEGHAWSLDQGAPATEADALSMLGLGPFDDSDDDLDIPPLRRVARELVEDSGSFLRVRPDRYSTEALAAAVLTCPLPVFGSPPADWQTVTTAISSGSPVAVGVTTYAATGQPVLAIVTTTTAYLLWFVHPSVLTARDSLRRKVEGRLGRIEPPPPATPQATEPATLPAGDDHGEESDPEAE